MGSENVENNVFPVGTIHEESVKALPKRPSQSLFSVIDFLIYSQQLALSKLSQSEMWNTLSPLQQRNLLMQKLNVPQPLPVEPVPQVETNPLSQLISQLQQVSAVSLPSFRWRFFFLLKKKDYPRSDKNFFVTEQASHAERTGTEGKHEQHRSDPTDPATDEFNAVSANADDGAPNQSFRRCS